MTNANQRIYANLQTGWRRYSSLDSRVFVGLHHYYYTLFKSRKQAEK